MTDCLPGIPETLNLVVLELKNPRECEVKHHKKQKQNKKIKKAVAVCFQAP